MAYIGRQNLGGAYRQLDDISSGFDGSDTTHTMQVNSQNVTVGDVNQIILSLGGVIQKPGTDFAVSGSVLTFTTAPAANTSFFAVLLGSDNGGTVTPTDGSVTASKLASDIAITTSGNTSLDGGTFVFNESGADKDFRIEGDTKANLFFADASTDRVGINTNAPDMLLDVTGTVSAGGGSDEKLQQWNIGSDNVKAEIEYLDTSSERGYAIGTSSQHHFMLRTNDATRIKINETGGLILTNPLADVYAIDNQITPSSGNVYGQKNTFENTAPDNNTSSFYWGNDNVTARFGVYSDGDVKNHDNSYGSFSDERIKQNIRDANSQWDDIKAVKVRNYKKKDDVRQYGDSAWEQIGVIAQELEASGMDKLIKHANPSEADITSSSEFGTLNDDGTIKEIKAQVKGVSYTVLYMKAVKALQEAMARIETLEADVKTLKGE